MSLVKDRTKRMVKIFYIKLYLTEATVFNTCYLENSNFLRTNVSKASIATIVLMER